MAVPRLLYRSESPTLIKQQENRDEVAELRFLSSLRGCRRTGHVTNRTIRQELNIFNILKIKLSIKTDLFLHMKRIKASIFDKMYYKYIAKGGEE
jgi:hypothetical protein